MIGDAGKGRQGDAGKGRQDDQEKATYPDLGSAYPAAVLKNNSY